jgi:ATP-binding cassette, subfamily C, bacterial CydCD
VSPYHRRLLASGRTATASLASAVALGVISALLAIAQAWLLARAITGAFQDGEGTTALAPVLAALVVVVAARAVLAWLAEIVAQRISGAVKARLRVALLARAVALGPRWAAGQASSEVTLLATRGLDALDAYYGRYLPQLALAAIVPAAVVVCLFAADVVAAITVALTVPLIPVFMVLIGQLSDGHRRRRWLALSRLAHRFEDVVAGLPTLRAFGRADAQVQILRRITDAYRSTTMATLRIAFLSALSLELLATLSVALVAVGIGLRLAVGDMTLETGLFVLVLAPEAYLPLRRLGAEFHASEEGLTAAAAAFAIIDAPDDALSGGAPDALPGGAPDALPGGAPDARHREARHGTPPAPLAGLAVEGVAVAQPGRDVVAPAAASLEVRAGEIVALTGPSGSGKSSLLLVILGLLRPTSGRVLAMSADGRRIDIAQLEPGAWRAQLAWVPQVPFVFAGTVADNVRLGAPDASERDVDDALAAVGLGDLPGPHRIGERGRGLSSGQRRRVGIARALVRGAPILLLDEPTAGLDEIAEAAVLLTLRGVADRGTAVLLVAHRPGAIAGADRTVAVTWSERAGPRPGVGAAPGGAAAAGQAP